MQVGVSVFVVLCLVFVVVDCEDVSKLNETMPGVCVTTLKQPKTRMKKYSQKTFRYYTLPNCRSNCRRKKTVFIPKTKIEQYVETVNRSMCCGGWSYSENGTHASCQPLCQPACPQGADCIAPDSCRCRSPLVPDNTPLTACVLPPCEPGYQRNSPEVCKPICSTCNRGDCIAPDICSCHDGYVNPAGNVSSCEPICPKTCLNGRCHSPDVCTCDAGFESRDGKSCVPVCQNGCSNGKCVAPDVCECDDGYDKRNLTCVPHCAKNCKNGICAGPDRCKCLQGYTADAVDKFMCNPVCSRTCVKGKCVAPDLCECKPGYEQDQQDQFNCRPTCSRPCGEAGRCTAPETCTCYPGFKVEDETGACKPTCSRPCVNGQCTSPERCSCNDGFRLVNKFACAPHCSPTCVNAECVSPGNCSCLVGFQKTNYTTCIPKCDHCSNGTCTAPGDCKCYEGFAKVNGSCRPVCSDACANGQCVAPGKCICNTGYTKFNSTCLPVCSKPCTNGFCSSPETCICKSGYILSEDNVCKKLCLKPCHMGQCSIDGVCECRDGYNLRVDDPFTCDPIKEIEMIESKNVVRKNCSTCLGKCEAEGVCRCEDGILCDQVSAAMQEAPKEPVAERYMSEIPWSWVYGGVGLLVLLAVVMGAERIWRQRNNKAKSHPSADCQESWSYNSVMPAAPGSLLMRDAKEFSSDDKEGQNSQDPLMTERDRTHTDKQAREC